MFHTIDCKNHQSREIISVVISDLILFAFFQSWGKRKNSDPKYNDKSSFLQNSCSKSALEIIEKYLQRS